MTMKLDPVSLEILITKVTATSEEMGTALQRSGRTIYVKETQDFGTGLVNLDGKLFGYPISVGSSSMLDNDAAAVIAAVPDVEPGDVIITNHPFLSNALSTHLPDLHALQPYFHEGKVVCYGWCFVHLGDVGGRVPSSISPSNSDIFQEGLMIPPVKIVKAGKFNSDVINFISCNSRTGDANLGDLKAMMGALAVGEKRVAGMIAQHGIDVVEAATSEIIKYTARKARDAFRTLPDGVYEFSDYLDDDFVSSLPVRLCAKMEVTDGAIHVDFDGTDPQVLSAYNVPTGGARHSWLTLRFMHYAVTRDPSLPINAGIFDSITMSVPEGSILNPVFPAAVGVRHATGSRVMDLITGLLAQAAPDFVRAAGSGLLIPVVLAEPPDERGVRKVDVIEPMPGGTGGRFGHDGVDGRDPGISGLSNNPVETVESSGGVTLHRYGLRPNSGGPGKWRGGVGLELTFSAKRGGSQVLGRGMERFRFVPWGLLGGKSAEQARTVLNKGRADERELGKIDMIELKAGETITILTPGGGGYGDPFERDPAMVLRDIKRGFVTADRAETDYGVVINGGAVDETATAELRNKREKFSGDLFDFGPERELWRRVFDEKLLSEINNYISTTAVSGRAATRNRIFAPLAKSAGKGVPFDEASLRQARRDVVEQLKREQEELQPMAAE